MTRFFPLVAVVVAVLAASPANAQPPQAPTAPQAAAATSGAEFLAKNAREPGVQTLLPSGLQYKVVAAGPAGGASPKQGDIIKVHYEGKLVSGQVFESSFARGKPVIMPLDNLVPAWMEALPRMKVGDEWMLYVPAELGYGASGTGPIPPNSVLVFRVRLLGMLSTD